MPVGVCSRVTVVEGAVGGVVWLPCRDGSVLGRCERGSSGMRGVKVLVAVVVVALLGASAAFAATTFEDVPEGAFYDEPTAWAVEQGLTVCLLYTSPSPRDATLSRMPSSA